MKFRLMSCLLLVMFIAAAFTSCGRKYEFPEQVTLYIEEQQRIITLDHTDYIKGCIFACSEPSWQQETLIAAGIAANSRALYCISDESVSIPFGADLTNDPAVCSLWTDPAATAEEYEQTAPEYVQRVEEAAETAANLYVEYDGAAADTPMCLLSTGVTDDCGKPYIPSLELSCDAESPEQLSGCVYPSDSLIRMMSEVTGSVMLPPDHSQWFTDAEYTAGGTLQSVCFGGKTVTGEQLREILGMRSAAITVVSSYDEFEFTAAGIGGNTGMSLYAAERLSRGGKTARQIIEYFFPGTSVKSIR